MAKSKKTPKISKVLTTIPSMNNFDIDVVRIAWRFKTINVQAENLQQAENKALDIAGDYEFPGEKDADYFIQGKEAHDGISEIKAIQLAILPFLCGDTPNVEYQKLLAAQAKGHGDKPALRYALVWEPIQFLSVDNIIEQVKNLADAIHAGK